MRDPLDRFYTPDDTVAQCLAEIALGDYGLIVEPSAGTGAFSSRIEGVLAYDLAPESGDIIEADWMTVSSLPVVVGKPTLVIGNPPFGTRGSLAKKFVSHSINLGADTIAFILPNTFRKLSNQSMFDQNWRLVKSISIVNTHFAMIDGSDLHIPCTFFVWTRLDDYLPGIDLREQKVVRPVEFSFLKRGDITADFTVNGNSGKVKELSEVTNSKAEHYIKVNDGYTVDAVKTVLENIDHDFVSSVNGGVAWLNRDDLCRAFHAAQS